MAVFLDEGLIVDDAVALLLRAVDPLLGGALLLNAAALSGGAAALSPRRGGTLFWRGSAPSLVRWRSSSARRAYPWVDGGAPPQRSVLILGVAALNLSGVRVIVLCCCLGCGAS